jgi:hypothetical protein
MTDELQPEVGKLSREEVATIISLIVDCGGKFALVKLDFHRIYRRHISLATIKDIASKYESKIARLEKDLRERGMTNPLSRANFRFKMLDRVYKDACVVRHRGWRRVNSEQSEKIIDWDHVTQLKVLSMAHQMDMDLQNIAIAKEKLNKMGSGLPDMTNRSKNDEQPSEAHLDDYDDGASFG